MALPSIALIPTGTKAGKLYSVLPEDGSGDFTVVRATTATRVNENGLIESVANNVPRLDYTNGGCPVLLTEPQSTNLSLYSEDFSNAVWTNTGAATTVTVNNAASPDGTITGNLFTDNLIDDRKAIFDDISVTANQPHTISVYLKNIDLHSFRIVLAYDATDWTTVQVDLSNNTLSIDDGSSNLWTSISSSISSTSVNGYYRLTLSGTHPTATTIRQLYCTSDGTAISNTNSYGRPSYLGTNSSILVWGAMLEQLAYSTSYIPTVATSVTRNADQVTDSGDVNDFNDSEGTLMIETATLISGADGRITISDGTTSNRASLEFDINPNVLKVFISSGGTLGASLQYTADDLTTANKISISYKVNDANLWINGFLVDNDPSVVAPIGLDRLDLDNGAGASDLYAKTKQIQVFKSALTSLEIETLTSWVSFSAMASAQEYLVY